jgi:hypothetical protein
MVRPTVLALLLALAAAPAAAQDEEDWDLPDEQDAGAARRLYITAWGGEAFETGGSGRSGTALGGEVVWAFDALDVGLWANGYRNLRDARGEWSPVLLLRLTERFETRRGLEAAISFGLGAARPDDWRAWFQLALGARLDLGPAFLAGELSFEEYDLLRLAAGLGVRF